MLHSVYLFLNIGTGELMLIFFVALLLFGGDKLPGIARTLGRGIRDFKDASEDVKREINNQINSFDEKTERKKKQEQAVAENEEVISSDVQEPEQLPAASESSEPVEVNNTATEAPVESEDSEEIKKPDFTRPANTIEYKG